jgi:hypothetical protein
MGSIAVIVSETEGRRSNDGWKIITSLVLDGLSSPHTRRAYSQALDEFLIWFHDDPGRQFNKATVKSTAPSWRPRAWHPPASTSACLRSAAWPSKPLTTA